MRWVLLFIGIILAPLGVLVYAQTNFASRGMPRRYASYVAEYETPWSVLVLIILAGVAIGISSLFVSLILRRRNDDS